MGGRGDEQDLLRLENAEGNHEGFLFRGKKDLTVGNFW